MAKAKYTYNPKRKEWYTLVYDGTFTANGAKHRKRLSSKKSSADLEKKVIQFKQIVEEAGASASCPYTWQEYARIWLDTAKSTREQNTRRMYETIINSCFHSINHVPLTQITHSHLQRCINEKLNHPRTCQQIALTFKQIIKSAVRDRYLPRTAIGDILSDISLPKYLKPVKRPLSVVEKQAITGADLEPMKRAYISILYYCGLRKGEALALSPSDFDWDAKTVSVSKAWITYRNQPSIKPYPKSDNGVRTVPIPDVAVPLIKPYAEAAGRYLFHGQNAALMTADAYKRMWESIITQLNIAVGYRPRKDARADRPIQTLTAHVLRHNYCTELCYQIPVISTKMIAKLMGDTEKMVLEVYSHILEEKEDATLAINNVFS